MALLKANFTDYQKLSLNLNTDTLKKLHAYALFLGSTSGKADKSAKLEEVVDQALNYVFARDAEFKKFFAKQHDLPPVQKRTRRTAKGSEASEPE